MCVVNAVSYIPWKKCTKRDQEAREQKEEPYFQTDAASGLFKMHRGGTTAQADTSSDGLLRNCLTRRDLAFDNCRLVNFLCFQAWTDTLMDAYQGIPEEDHEGVSISQLQKADLALFRELQKITESAENGEPEGILPRQDGSFPLEDALKKAMNRTSVVLHLTPQRRVSTHASQSNIKKVKQVHKTNNSQKGEAKGTNQAKGSGKNAKSSASNGAKGKAKESRQSFIRMPKALIGMLSKDAEGGRLCFDYNIGGCNKAPPGGKCSSGSHFCCVPGCLSDTHNKSGHKY